MEVMITDLPAASSAVKIQAAFHRIHTVQCIFCRPHGGSSVTVRTPHPVQPSGGRSEEHTSELQSLYS